MALKQNETSDLVPIPNGVKSISCKLAYKVKRRLDGSIERYKARLVARGFSNNMVWTMMRRLVQWQRSLQYEY